MRLKKKILFAFIVATSIISAKAQSVDFTQYYLNNAGSNPGYTGSEEFLDTKMSFRQGWNTFGIRNNYVYASAYTSLNNSKRGILRQNGLRLSDPEILSKVQSTKAMRRKHGIGGMVTDRKLGPYELLSASANYAYHLPIGRTLSLGFGTKVGIQNQRIDFTGYTVRDDDYKIGNGTLTSTTAWRYWYWDPSNDRDFTGLQALAKSQNHSNQTQWTEEIRYAGKISDKVSGVVGLFYMDQDVVVHGTEESGNAQWRFSQSTTSNLWKTPGLFDGYGIHTDSDIKSTTAAAFANVDWEIVNGLHLQPGVRYNYDKKDAVYDRTTYGGLQTTDPQLLALKQLVYADQSYVSGASKTNFTYNVTMAYRPSARINAFGTYSTSYKPIGVNVTGLPTINNAPALDLAVVAPEYTKHYEFGIKTTPIDNLTFNVVYHNSDIKDYQTNVQSPELGVNRGYLATAEKVNVKGVEIDANLRAGNHFTFNASGAYTDGKYVTFTNAPLPLEDTGLTQDGKQLAFTDISGQVLPGISKWATSVGGEFTVNANFLRQSGKFFVAFDTYYRSSFSSSPTPSAFLNIDGYAILNGRLGFRTTPGTSITIWSRNLTNNNYYEQLLIAGGNAGQYAGVIGDPRTYGITIKHTF
ncbi:MAG: TonB-dependent receptor [Bacteroidota bacterium]